MSRWANKCVYKNQTLGDAAQSTRRTGHKWGGSLTLSHSENGDDDAEGPLD